MKHLVDLSEHIALQFTMKQLVDLSEPIALQ